MMAMKYALTHLNPKTLCVITKCRPTSSITRSSTGLVNTDHLMQHPAALEKATHDVHRGHPFFLVAQPQLLLPVREQVLCEKAKVFGTELARAMRQFGGTLPREMH